jgi:hypothetical protein
MTLILAFLSIVFIAFGFLDIIKMIHLRTVRKVTTASGSFKPWLFLILGLFFGIWCVLNFLREATAAFEAL